MNIAIVGATGAVGMEMMECLRRLSVRFDKLRLCASDRSAGKMLETPFGEIVLEKVSKEIFEECDFALFSAGSAVSLEWREVCEAADCVMIDNSSAFRNEEGVPLIVPEVNGDVLSDEAAGAPRVVANPNCTTAILAVALWPLYQEFGLERVIVSTYQAASGAGAKGMDELLTGTRAHLDNEEVSNEVFAHPLPFNVIPHIDSFQDNGYTKEEMKVCWETRKIFGLSELPVSCTAVRIPTLRAHSESVVIECSSPVDASRAREILDDASGVRLVDDTEENEYPMPSSVAGQFDVEVGRVRRSLVFGDKGLEFFVSGDQLLKGAALNAVQILKLMI